MAAKVKAIRGMNDRLPQDALYWQRLTSVFARVVHQAGYQEIVTPVCESTALFKRSMGGDTDIVSKEMYTFEDRNGDSLSLRPEGTASVVRAGIEHGLLYNQQQRLYYQGPMFRHERPQKGRYRQFHQLGVEAIGFAGAAIEAESIAMSYRLLEGLGLANGCVCQLNHLGSSEEREAFKSALLEMLTPIKEQLDADSQRRLGTNPLRILDSKVPQTQALLQNAPSLYDFLSAESKAHIEQLRAYLEALSIPVSINTRLVRGLDYYTGVVFEWVSDALGAQGTVCAGGRYDNLVAQLGGRASPAFGWAAGMERLVLLMQSQVTLQSEPDVYVIVADETLQAAALKWVDQLRSAIPTCNAVMNVSAGSLKTQFKRADKSHAKQAVIFASEEYAQGLLIIKPLRQRSAQLQLSEQDAINQFKEGKSYGSTNG